MKKKPEGAGKKIRLCAEGLLSLTGVERSMEPSLSTQAPGFVDVCGTVHSLTIKDCNPPGNKMVDGTIEDATASVRIKAFGDEASSFHKGVVCGKTYQIKNCVYGVRNGQPEIKIIKNSSVAESAPIALRHRVSSVAGLPPDSRVALRVVVDEWGQRAQSRNDRPMRRATVADPTGTLSLYLFDDACAATFAAGDVLVVGGRVSGRSADTLVVDATPIEVDDDALKAWYTDDRRAKKPNVWLTSIEQVQTAEAGSKGEFSAVVVSCNAFATGRDGEKRDLTLADRSNCVVDAVMFDDDARQTLAPGTTIDADGTVSSFGGRSLCIRNIRMPSGDEGALAEWWKTCDLRTLKNLSSNPTLNVKQVASVRVGDRCNVQGTFVQEGDGYALQDTTGKAKVTVYQARALQANRHACVQNAKRTEDGLLIYAGSVHYTDDDGAIAD